MKSAHLPTYLLTYLQVLLSTGVKEDNTVTENSMKKASLSYFTCFFLKIHKGKRSLRL